MKLLRIIILLLLTQTVFAANGKQKLVVSPDNFNFGVALKDTEMSANVWLKSVGSDTVEITKIETGCECTTIPLETNIIAPGDSVEISINWSTVGTYGSVKRHPRFYYKGSTDPARLELKASVVLMHDSTTMPVSIWPFKFEMANFSLMRVDSLEFKMINTTDKKAIPSLVTKLPAQCILEIPSEIPPFGQAWGFVKLKPEFLDKEFQSSFTLGFSNEPKFFITVPIRRKNYSSDAD